MEGFPLVFLSNEVYTSNHNYIANEFRSKSLIYAQQSDKTTPVALTNINNTYLSSYGQRAESVIKVVRTLTLTCTNVAFNGNYIEDTGTPSTIIQSQALLLADFYGYLTISGNTLFSYHTGLSYVNSVATIMDATLLKGYSTSFLVFYRAEIASLTI